MLSDPSPTPAGATGEQAEAPWGEMSETTAEILAAAEANLAASRRLGAQRLALAYAWAGAHEKPAGAPMRGSTRREGALRRLAYRELGATGIPVAEDAPAELGISLAISSTAARHLIADAIDLVHRLPRTWTAIQHGDLEAWVGRKIARLSAELSDQAARWVDSQLADHHDLPTGRLLSRAEAIVVAADRAAADANAERQRRAHTLHLGRQTEHGTRTLFARCEAADALRFYAIADQLARALQHHDREADTETLDQLRARAIGILANPALALTLLAGAPPDETEPDETKPHDGHDDTGLLSDAALDRLARMMRGRTTLYLHLTPAMLATGTGSPGPVARAEGIGAMTRDMLLRLLGHEHVTLKPVINLAEHLTSDRYEVPAAIGERLALAKPHDVFPYAESLSRRQDQDHSASFDPARAVAGDHQTHLGNLGHLTRHHHRIKTHAPGWRTWQLDNGTHLWRTPHGRYRLVDQRGTHTVQLTDTGPPGSVSLLEQRLAQLTAAVA